MPLFELNRLADYSDEEIQSELRRVSAIVGDKPLSRGEFNKHAKVASSTVTRRFGGWQQALLLAGIGDRYSGTPVSEKMKVQPAKSLSNEQLIAELQHIAAILGKNELTVSDVNQHSSMINAKVIKNRFGTWKSGLEAAGLGLTNYGKRYTEDEYFENLLTVWSYHGRQPLYREMNMPPSIIGSSTYEKKWGTWYGALQAFVEKANTDLAEPVSNSSEVVFTTVSSTSMPTVKSDADKHEIKLGLRYSILCRDRFKCVICGSSPATDITCQLHVDHIIPFAKGGKTVSENLRSLCLQCNLGKGSKLEISCSD